MTVEISKVDVWSGEINDRCGGLADKIEAVAEAGANLEFVIARRAPNKPGSGLAFMAPLRGTIEAEAATAAGLAIDPKVHTLRLEAPNQPGLGARIARAVADAGINMRGLSGTALDRRCGIYLSFDSGADAERARRILSEAFGDK